MTKEEQKEFFTKYAYMFGLADKEKTIEEEGCYYPISFGFECSEGWHPLITELIEKIAELDTDKQVKVLQIKEKFATLRFYINYGTDEMYELINEYEKKSSKTCEMCGEAGKYRGDLSWRATLCNRHYIERNPKAPINNAEIKF